MPHTASWLARPKNPTLLRKRFSYFSRSTLVFPPRRCANFYQSRFLSAYSGHSVWLKFPRQGFWLPSVLVDLERQLDRPRHRDPIIETRFTASSSSPPCRISSVSRRLSFDRSRYLVHRVKRAVSLRIITPRGVIKTLPRHGVLCARSERAKGRIGLLEPR